MAIQVFDKGFHLFKFDLMSGFHHMEIFHAHQKFLTFQLCVLPLGLSSAPFVFNKVFKAVLKSRGSKGMTIVIFLDDGLGGGADPVSTQINSLVVHFDLLKSGCKFKETSFPADPFHVALYLQVPVSQRV